MIPFVGSAHGMPAGWTLTILLGDSCRAALEVARAGGLPLESWALTPERLAYAREQLAAVPYLAEGKAPPGGRIVVPSGVAMRSHTHGGRQ